jgi:beta-glucanase (GH16 family)
MALVLTIVTYSSIKAGPISTSTAAISYAPAGYTNLIFDDEFDIWNSVWHHGYSWTKEGDLSTVRLSNNEQEAYDPANVTVSNGLLNITAKKQTVTVGTQTYYYTSGLIETGADDYGYPYKFTFQYGYMEARIKVPSGQGLWPAFWLWPANYKDPPEIDVMEMLGSQPRTDYMTYHYSGGSTQYTYNGPDFSQDFHIYGCEWTPDYIAWYLDGVEVARFSNSSLVPQQPMYLILNLAVGGNWPGPVSDSVLPATMLVDWVHVYQKNTIPGSAPIATLVSATHTSTLQPITQSSTSTTYDDSNSAFVYSLGWQKMLAGRAYGGSYKQTNATNSSATLNFTGKALSVLYTSGPGCGRIAVYVDGVLIGIINEKTSKLHYQQRWNYTGQLSAGSHKLQLIFISSSKDKGSLDAVIVQ